MIDSSDYRDMQALLEEKARDLARLQQQVEELQHSLEAYIPTGRASVLDQAPPPQPPGPSDVAAPLQRQQAHEPPPARSMARTLPRRITVSLNDYVHQRLIERSLAEGRSISNLAAFIIESHLE